MDRAHLVQRPHPVTHNLGPRHRDDGSGAGLDMGNVRHTVNCDKPKLNSAKS